MGSLLEMLARGSGKAAFSPRSSASWCFDGVEVLGCVLWGDLPLCTQKAVVVEVDFMFKEVLRC